MFSMTRKNIFSLILFLVLISLAIAFYLYSENKKLLENAEQENNTQPPVELKRELTEKEVLDQLNSLRKSSLVGEVENDNTTSVPTKTSPPETDLKASDVVKDLNSLKKSSGGDNLSSEDVLKMLNNMK